MDCADVDVDHCIQELVTHYQRSKEEEQQKHLLFSKKTFSLHCKFMDKYVFCDNVVFNNMPIYTYLFCTLFLPVIKYFAVSSPQIMFRYSTAPSGGHLVL